MLVVGIGGGVCGCGWSMQYVFVYKVDADSVKEVDGGCKTYGKGGRSVRDGRRQ